MTVKSIFGRKHHVWYNQRPCSYKIALIKKERTAQVRIQFVYDLRK